MAVSAGSWLNSAFILSGLYYHNPLLAGRLDCNNGVNIEDLRMNIEDLWNRLRRIGFYLSILDINTNGHN
jgi:hypothetical protein